ncbi:MAG TPA: S53 family peptidase [Acidimicrobiales bacterium]|nr:S53 family peptidase [Acidimicrobiales bacterium]
MASERVAVAGSERAEAAHPVVAPVDGEEVAAITVYLRQNPGGPDLAWVDEEAARPPRERGRMSRDELATTYGPSDADLSALSAFASEHALAVTSVDIARRAVVLSGRLADFAAAFGTELSIREHPTAGRYRARSGPLTVPADIGGAVVGVFGLDQRPQALTQHRIASAAAPASFTPPQVAALYDFPAGGPGTGEVIGIVELGGGFAQADIDAYFAQIGQTPPSVTAVGVDGGTNSPGNPNGPDAEVMLDIEVAGSVAPGAAIVVYFAPNTDQGFIDAVSTAVHDTTHRPTVVSISWGAAENTWTAQAMNQMEQAFIAAAAAGVTVTVAAGDNGSSDGQSDGAPHVDFPASAPHALGCGGTTLSASGGAGKQAIASETVWNDGASGGATGGGVSAQFPLPSYQKGANVPPGTAPGGRGVPDVAGDADPQTGYQVRVDGQSMVIGGTSAVAPLWAGLVALLNAKLGAPVGFLQPRLYTAGPEGTMHDITQGSNGAYQAGAGWDPCTGLGSPDGAKLLAALEAPAGG